MNSAENTKQCKELCWSCRTCCQETFARHCLEMGGEHVAKEHAKLMLDCVQICQTAADFMDRESALHAYTCEVCAVVCEACSKSCARINSESMQKCAEICRQCAESCRSMGKTKKAA